MATKSKTTKKTTRKTGKKATKPTPKVNGKSLAAGEKPDETIEQKKKQVFRQQNIELIKALKNEVKGQFSIGSIAKQFDIPFQKARYLIHQIAKHAGKSVVQLKRGIWSLE